MLKSLVFVFCIINPAAIAADNIFTIFDNANINDKHRIIDSLLASGNIPYGFFDRFLNDSEYSRSLKTDSSYINLRNGILNKILDIPDQNFAHILEKYYYHGSRARKLIRPTTYQLKYNWQKIGESVKAPDGTIWAITAIWWFGCYQDLWLVEKLNESDSIWSGPWFTGIRLGYSMENNYGHSNNYLLEFKENQLHLIIPKQDIDKIISPEILTFDRDKDGLYDLEEERFTTDPDDNDTDGDGLLDGEDMNPLAPPNGTLSDEDKIKLTLIRGGDGYPYSIIVVPVNNGRRLEYYGDCSSCIFLSLDSTALAKFEKDCPGRRYGGANFIVNVAVRQVTPDSITASMDSHQAVNSFDFKLKNGIWIVVHRAPIMLWD